MSTSKPTTNQPQIGSTSQQSSSNPPTNTNPQIQTTEKTSNVSTTLAVTSLATTVTNTTSSTTGSVLQQPTNTQPQPTPATKTTKTQHEDEKKAERQQILQESTTNLIINYIPPDMNEGALGTLFSPYGAMQNIKIVVDPNTGRSRGYGFVKYESAESAVRAQIALNGYSVGGKKLKVAYSRPQSKEIQNSNLYVTGVPLDWTNERLGQVFKPFGFVVESRILLDQDGRPRGVGFVRMDNHANAIKAIGAVHQLDVDEGIELVVKLAQKKNQNRRWGMNPNGRSPNSNDGGGYMFDHGNTGRRSGGMVSDQYGDPSNNFPDNQGRFYKRGPSNRRQPYRSRADPTSDFANAEANFYPPLYDPYVQQSAYYGSQGIKEPGDTVTTNQQTGGMNTLQGRTNPRGYTGESFNLVVHNLPEYYNVDHLIKLYAPFGPIQSVNIQKSPNHYPDQPPSSYGIVSYFYVEDAKHAIAQTNGKKENGCILHVTWQ